VDVKIVLVMEKKRKKIVVKRSLIFIVFSVIVVKFQFEIPNKLFFHLMLLNRLLQLQIEKIWNHKSKIF